MYSASLALMAETSDNCDFGPRFPNTVYLLLSGLQNVGQQVTWHAPIGWPSLNVSASWASGLSGRCFPALAGDIPMRCAA